MAAQRMMMAFFIMIDGLKVNIFYTLRYGATSPCAATLPGIKKHRTGRCFMGVTKPLFLFMLLGMLLIEFVVGLDDGFNQPVPYHIFFIQFYMGNAIYVLQDLGGFKQTALLVFWQIDLCRVTRNDRFR